MIFVEASAVLALENRQDSYHSKALNVKDDCLKSGQAFIASDFVLDESDTIIRLRAGHTISVQFGESLRKSHFIRVEYLTPGTIEKAWRLFKAFSDHDFSFADCSGFALMERLHIRAAFTCDAHFREYGRFTLKP